MNKFLVCSGIGVLCLGAAVVIYNIKHNNIPLAIVMGIGAIFFSAHYFLRAKQA
jgi:hypothetical protein